MEVGCGEPGRDRKVGCKMVMVWFVGHLASGLRVRGDRAGLREGPPHPIVKHTDL